MSLTEDLLAIEERLWTEGPDAYRENLEADCLIVFPSMAGEMTREEVAGSVPDGPRWRDLEMEPVGLRPLSDDIMVLTYRAVAKRPNGEVYRALLSSVYVRHEGAWKMAFHQQTPLDAGDDR